MKTFDFVQAMICLALVRLHIAQGQADQALKWMPRLLEFYRSAPSLEGQIQTLIQQSIAQYAQGDRARALTSLRNALTLAEPEGYVRIFVEAGPSLAELLRQALAQGAAPVYVRQLGGRDTRVVAVNCDDERSYGCRLHGVAVRSDLQ